MTDDEDYELFENAFYEWLGEHGCKTEVTIDGRLACLDMDLNKLKRAIAVLIMNTP